MRLRTAQAHETSIENSTLEKQPPGRIHGLDALRAILMLLGVVLHTVINYLPTAPGWGWGFRDPTAHADWTFAVLDFIHLFRMPAFFVISGFFGALLWHKRGALRMLRNRVARIVWPLFVFLLLLWPAVIFAFRLGARIVDGHPTPVSRGIFAPVSQLFPPIDTMHLWFLYHLSLITFAVAGSVALMERYNVSRPNWLEKIRRAAESPWRSLGVFGSLSVLWFGVMRWKELPTSTAWIPDPTILVYYLFCYAIGWLFFTTKVDISTLKHRAWTFIGLGVGCMFLRIATSPMVEGEVLTEYMTTAEVIFFGHWIRYITAGIAVVLLTRGFSGLFIRYASAESYGWRYISDSSYWVYLLHLPLCVIFPALLLGWDAPVLVKWCVSMTLVAATCVATYDLFVRSSFVGHFLNGRRYPRSSLSLSAGATFILVSGVAYGLNTIPPPHERPSNWLKGATAEALLPDEQVISPLPRPDAPPVDASLTRCIQVRRYVICSDRVTFKTAGESCEAFGGHLIVMNDEAENTDVSDLLWKLTQSPFWLGITDQDEEGTWHIRQSDAEPEFTAWHKHQPDDWGGKEDCATGNWGESGKWNDMPCKWRGGFVCEFEADRRVE